MPGEMMQRLFFALCPPDDVREKISSTVKAVSGLAQARLIPPENYHITLHYLGATPLESRDCLCVSAREISLSGFDLQLDRFGHFRRPKITWLGPEKTPVALSRLYRSLGSALADCECAVEERRYTPHVSLARKAGEIELPPTVEPIHWMVTSFSLMKSVIDDAGVHYKEIERYLLC